LSFISFSFSSALASPRGGRKEGILAGGGDDDGDLCSLLGFCNGMGPGSGNPSFKGPTMLGLESEVSESDSDSDSEATAGFGVSGTFLTVSGGDFSSSEEDDSELEEELDTEIARLLRFLVRFLGAGFVDLAGGIGKSWVLVWKIPTQI